VVGSEGTGLTSYQIRLTGYAQKIGRAHSVIPKSQVMRKKPNFVVSEDNRAKAKQSVRRANVDFFITKSKEASTVITLVFIIYSINACVMDCIFRYK
jgi:hypothetical protein